jgi:hypothetical protein
VAGDLRRGRGLAIQQGHRASLSQVSGSAAPVPVMPP